MNYVHFFQWNIPQENQSCGFTDSYINVIATWNGTSYYKDGRPMVSIDGANLSFYDCIKVKNWHIAHTTIEKLAEQHFAEIAKAERIAQARAELIAAGEPTGNPVLDRYTGKQIDLQLEKHLS